MKEHIKDQLGLNFDWIKMDASNNRYDIDRAVIDDIYTKSDLSICRVIKRDNDGDNYEFFYYVLIPAQPTPPDAMAYKNDFDKIMERHNP